MKKRIIGVTLLTVVCALLLSNLVGVLIFCSREMDAARDTLQELLVLMDAQSADTDPQELARQFSQAAPGKRLTIIDTDGTVLADTGADPEGLENHGNRPEVESAAATGWGEAVRHSDTMGTSMFYVAKKFADGMIGRASMPLSSIDSLVVSSLWSVFIASAAALLLALLLARRTANRVVAPLNAVSQALQGVLDGTGKPGLEEYQSDDELRPILRYIDKLMERLGGYIQSITDERDKVALILDCMAEGLILLDEDGRVLAINRAARTIFGFPEGGGGRRGPAAHPQPPPAGGHPGVPAEARRRGAGRGRPGRERPLPADVRLPGGRAAVRGPAGGYLHPHLRRHRAEKGGGDPQRVYRQRVP